MKLFSNLFIISIFTTSLLFGQDKKNDIVFDVNKNKTHIINLVINDTLTIDGKWEEVKKIKNKFEVNYHFIGLKNINNDFIEIAVNNKNKTQFYSNSISDVELLKSSKEFESYKCKANYNSFNPLKSDNQSFFTYYVENKRTLITTLIGIIQDYYLVINYYPNSKNEPAEIDKLIQLFQSIKFN